MADAVDPVADLVAEEGEGVAVASAPVSACAAAKLTVPFVCRITLVWVYSVRRKRTVRSRYAQCGIAVPTGMDSGNVS